MGIITYNFELSIARTMIGNGYGPSDEADELLKFLPRETIFLGFDDITPSITLNHCYVLKFFHPFFEDGSKIEVVKKLIAWTNYDPAASNRITQQDMIQSINYFGPDGIPYFSNHAHITPYVPVYNSSLPIKPIDGCICIGAPVKNCPDHGDING